jgi:hypothetical protein
MSPSQKSRFAESSIIYNECFGHRYKHMNTNTMFLDRSSLKKSFISFLEVKFDANNSELFTICPKNENEANEALKSVNTNKDDGDEKDEKVVIIAKKKVTYEELLKSILNNIKTSSSEEVDELKQLEYEISKAIYQEYIYSEAASIEKKNHKFFVVEDVACENVVVCPFETEEKAKQHSISIRIQKLENSKNPFHSAYVFPVKKIEDSTEDCLMLNSNNGDVVDHKAEKNTVVSNNINTIFNESNQVSQHIDHRYKIDPNNPFSLTLDMRPRLIFSIVGYVDIYKKRCLFVK